MAVAATGTALLGGLVTGVILFGAATPTGGGGGQDALTRLCQAALVAALSWAWLQVLAGVADAWRGASPAHRRGVRRLAMLACGAAAVGLLATPAQATQPLTAAPPGRPAPELLSGLPLPERPAGGPRLPAAPTQVVVRSGESLWSIARAGLGSAASDQQVGVAWRALYRDNLEVIGPDPDLILPGQLLRLPHLDSADDRDQEAR